MFFNLLSDREAIMAEMAVHVPFCVHTNIENSLFITHHPAELTEQAAKHGNSPKITHDVTESKFFDLIILDEFMNDDIFLKSVKALKDNGIMIARSMDSRVKDDLSKFDEHFRIVMPYHHLNLIFASNFFHPTADMILQKSDLIGETYYYNTEMHLAEFALPAKMKIYLRNQLKN